MANIITFSRLNAKVNPMIRKTLPLVCLSGEDQIEDKENAQCYLYQICIKYVHVFKSV